MSSLGERIKMLEFHNELLLKMIDAEKYPFYALLIKKGVTKNEMKDVFMLCEEVNKRFEEQQENGLIDYMPLLTHFVGMLNPKLSVQETVSSLYKQDYYPSLMMQLNEIVKKIEGHRT